MKKVIVLGATGSIGTSALDLIRKHSDEFTLCGISANLSKEKLFALKEEFGLNEKNITLSSADGEDGIARILDEGKPDIVVNGIAGAAGLYPSKLVLERGIDLALANKETVVMAWPLIKALADKNNAHIIPVDSEHSAIFCLINQCGKENIDEIIITASGGPFRNMTKAELENVTVEDALKHPTWQMGAKITVDSASLANKGLEVIEARRLFGISTDKIKVVVHPQSLIHSLVRTNDGIMYAQISNPDMRHPIYGALSWPDIIPSGLEKFSLYGKTMEFLEPRYDDFPLLKTAFDAAEKAGGYTIAFNAADEIAAHAFIDKKIKFTRLSQIVQKVMEKDWTRTPESFDDVFEIDRKAREEAGALL